MKNMLAVLVVVVAGCGVPAADGEVDEAEQAIDPWYFCVDHPCPDLQAIPYQNPCNPSAVLVGVRNLGNLTAGNSTTRITFEASGRVFSTVDRATPSLPPGAAWNAFVTRPSRCNLPNPGCIVRVSADFFDTVNEPNGNNNRFSTACIN